MFVGIDYHGNKDQEIIKEQEQARRNLTRIALLHGYEPIEDIYEDEKDVFCLKKEEIIVTDNSSSSSDDESSE
ncbi:hypothetical protein Tco_0087031 [Tanacetum coccineum]